MRTWLLLAALSCAAIGLARHHRNEYDLTEKDVVLKVLKSWKHGAGVKYMEVFEDPITFRYVDDVEEVLEPHDLEVKSYDYSRSKRSIEVPHIRAAAPINKGCNKPGYTGEYCQYPVCSEKNNYVPNTPSTDQVSIDAVNLANCSEPYIILVDDTMWAIHIEIETDSPLNPNFYLQSEDGTIIFPTTDTPSPTSYAAVYEFLAPGQYLLGPRADLQSSYCSMIMTARTNLQVFGGFTSGYASERNDYPTLKYAYLDTESSVVLHADSLSYPAQIQVIGFTGYENHVSRYTELQPRFNCSYPYLLERYTCSKRSDADTGHNFFQVEGITNQGYKFRRIIAYQCVLAPVTTTANPPTTSPTPAPLTSCKNGGQLITNLDGSKYCYCFGAYTGVDCGTLTCMNGGTLPTPTSERCECPIGFSGFACENIICTDNSGLSFDAEHPTLTFVIRTRTQLSDVIEQFVNATSVIVNELSFDSNYLSSFIVVLYDNGKLLLNQRYDSFDKALVDLNKAILTAPSNGTCEDITFSAISTALSLYPENKSPVYVITDANPNDSAEKETVFHLESYWRAPLYFIYVTPSIAEGCNSSPDSSGYRDYIDIAGRTSGNTFYFTNRSLIYSFAYTHLKQTLYRSQLLLSNDLTHCGNQAIYKSVAIDTDTESLVVVATGTDLALYVTNPFGNHIDFNQEYFDGNNYIWSIRSAVSGQWFFTILSTSSSNAACSFKVYQKKYDTVVSTTADYDLFWGFSTSITSDGALKQPVYNFGVAPVFHLTNYPVFLSMDRVQAALSIYSLRNGNQTEIYGSNGIWRDACSLQFYFPEFTCQVPDETLYFNFFARDRVGMTIQRAGTMYCSRIHPTPTPDHQCQNGGVMNPSNTTCFCTPEYTGTYCQTLVCYNGGTNNGDHCACPPGWAGNSCEIPRCMSPGPNPEFLRFGVDMIFAVEVTQQGWASIATLNQNIQEIVRDIQLTSQNWVGKFVLVGFNSTWGGVIADAPAYNPTAFINALNTLSLTIPTDTGCNVKLWQGLNDAFFGRDLKPGSHVQIFQTSPEDDTDQRALGLFYTVSRTSELLIYGFLSVSPRWTPNGFSCNASVENYYTLFGIVGGSTGSTFLLQPAEISNAVRLIPLQYSSGIAGFNYASDCSAGLTTYIPIDAYTQTIQFNVFAYGGNLKVYDGQGNSIKTLELFYDDFTGMSVYEVRKACDDGWDASGQYCVKFIAGDEVLPMPQAKAYCGSAGGFLADDLTDDKHNYLLDGAHSTQFWIGLYNNGSTYVWDRGNYTSPSELSQDNTYWAGDGTQPPLDETKQCVYFDGQASNKQRVWTLDSCSTPRPFVCQKHRYDLDHRPNTIGDDDLPAGYWYAVLTNNATAQQTANCSLEVRVQSNLQIVTGYVTSVGDDVPQGDPVNDSKANRLVTYIHSLENENRSPILTDAILWDAYNGTFYNGLKYAPRFGCQYGWTSQEFPCPNGNSDANEFGVIHIGEDEFGHTFQRITFGHCSPAVITCGNGGIRFNGTCVCNDYWTGSQCTVPICANGGTRNSDERSCTCPAGYTGFNCEFELCQPKIPQTFTNDAKTLVLVVETTVQNNATVDTLIDNLSAIIANATSNAPSWFNNFALVTFDSTGTTFSNFAYSTINPLITALISAQNRISDKGACTQPIYGALNSALQNVNQIIFPNSDIIVFSSAGPSDPDTRAAVVPNLANSEARLHFVYSQTSCGDFQAVPNLLDLTWLAYGTSGNVLFTDSNNVVSLFNAYLPTLYSMSTLTHPTGHTNFSCSSGTPWYVEVDQNTTFIYITTTSEYGTLSVKDPLSRTHSPQVLYNVNDQKIYAIEVDRISGIWTLSLVNPPGLCFAHVYSVGGAKVYMKFTSPTSDDPTASHIDGTYITPAPGVANVATFELIGDPFHRGILTYVDIYDPATFTLVLRSELYIRGDCSYTYYSDPFYCQADMLGVFIFGVDENAQKFRRQETIFCNGVAPITTTTSNPATGTIITTTTTPGAAITSTTTNAAAITTTTTAPAAQTTTSYGYANQNFDIVFMIDVSQSAQAPFNNFTKFIQTLMVSYSVGTNAHVGVLCVGPDLNDQPPIIANLNAITSQTLLIKTLNDIVDFDFTDFDHTGQLLDLNLGVASDDGYTASSAGYRSGITNHLLLYITATTGFDTDPTARAKSIISSKKYGIITVGFGDAVDNSKLIAVSGGSDCSFTASDFVGLNNLIPSIQKKIWSADTNGGVYCSSN